MPPSDAKKFHNKNKKYALYELILYFKKKHTQKKNRKKRKTFFLTLV